MPLDPNKLSRKTPKPDADVLLAIEWSVIVFAGMLAVLFFAWALALQLPEIRAFTADQVSQTTSENPPGPAVIERDVPW